MSQPTNSTRPRAMRDALLEGIWQRMGQDPGIFFASGDFGSPVLDKIRADFPDRFVNSGIAEQNLINVSAGLALEGFTVFAYAIAPFLTMRCYEQIRVNLALLSMTRPMNINLIGVGAGYSYVVSGPTHQCYEDLTLMRALPNVTVLSPSDHVSSAMLLQQCLEKSGPKYLRLDAQILPVLYEAELPDSDKGFHLFSLGKDVMFVATGYMVHTALRVADKLRQTGIDAGVIDLFSLTGFQQNALLQAVRGSGAIVSLEEGFAHRGGLDAAIFQFLSTSGSAIPYLSIGVEPGYRFELGDRNHLHDMVGISADKVESRVRAFRKNIRP